MTRRMRLSRAVCADRVMMGIAVARAVIDPDASYDSGSSHDQPGSVTASLSACPLPQLLTAPHRLVVD